MGDHRMQSCRKCIKVFFFKLLHLSSSTPNYIVDPELREKHIILYRLYLSKGYINKIINYLDDRLPKLLAKEA